MSATVDVSRLVVHSTLCSIVDRGGVDTRQTTALIHSSTHSPSVSLTHPLTRSLKPGGADTHALTHSSTHSSSVLLTHSPSSCLLALPLTLDPGGADMETHTLIHSLILRLAYSLSHSH